ncbi:MAG: two-component sensor histidine kinase, partial [Desulfovibrio sp.]|nr:two-component sensor histidine kinase [Desulfovibrio sp.]
SVIGGLPVERLRIFDFSHRVAYSTDKDELGKTGLAPDHVDLALKGAGKSPELISTISPWKAWFHLPLSEGTFSMRALFPLRGEPLGTDRAQPVMGALELTQDITDDYERVMAFQGIIVVMCLLSSVLLFGVLLMLIQRSERVLADRILKNQKLESEIHSNEKFVSMGRVVASIAHEIRNPLGIIRSSAELLLRRAGSSDAGTKRILEAIHDESVRLSQTVNDFLDYARPRKPRGDVVDVSLVLDNVLAFLESEFKRHGVEVENDARRGLYAIGDKDLLYRAFYNILVNSQQAMSGPGQLQILGDRVFASPIGDGEAGWWVELQFLDSGPGFDAANLESILDPFFTTKEGGTGLGLPIVHSIISGHGGVLKLENRKEGGAVARIWLPAAEETGDE